MSQYLFRGSAEQFSPLGGSSLSPFEYSTHNTTSASHETSHHSLFGSFVYLHRGKVSYSLLIVVGAVLFIEGLFHVVHTLTDDTPFLKVVDSLEKELMIVGLTAFLFKIVVDTVNVDEGWFFALEVAG